MIEEEMPKTKDRTLLYLMLVITFAWGVFWIAILSHGFHIEGETTIWAIRGQFGDMFGALNALFSGLAFAGIIYSIRQQNEDLEIQRKVLKLTLIELTKAADAQRKAEVALNKQSATMTLTAMLNANKSMLDYYHNLSNSGSKALFSEQIQAPNNAKNCITKIEKILKRLENGEK